MSIDFAIRKLGYLEPSLRAVIDRARELSGNDLVLKEQIYVCDPNFFAMKIHAVRACHAVLFFYGKPEHFLVRQSASLKVSRFSYSEMRFERPAHKHAALSYLESAYLNRMARAQKRSPAKPVETRLGHIFCWPDLKTKL